MTDSEQRLRQREQNLAFLQTHPNPLVRVGTQSLPALMEAAPQFAFTTNAHNQPVRTTVRQDTIPILDDIKDTADLLKVYQNPVHATNLAYQYTTLKMPSMQQDLKVTWPFDCALQQASYDSAFIRKTERTHDGQTQDHAPAAAITIIYEFGLGNSLPALLTAQVAPRPSLLLFSERRVTAWQSLLDFFDLETLFARYHEQGITVALAVDIADHQNQISPLQTVLNKLTSSLHRLKCAIAFISPALEEVTLALAQVINRSNLNLISGGFLEDDFLFLAHEFDNENQCNSPQFGDFGRCPHHSVPAFVVGSGPSLDDNFEHLKQWQDLAIIIACGTAEGALLKNGIRPDLSCHLENTVINPLIHADGTVDPTRSGRLVVAASVSPRMFPYYQKAMLVYRDSSPLSELRSLSAYNIRLLGQNVGLLGATIALMSGADSIFLFGMDMGTRSGSGHCHGTVFGHHAFSGLDYQHSDTKTRANFGGTVYDIPLMRSIRAYFENEIFNRQVMIFNCSDGAYIENTTPKDAASLILPTGDAYAQQKQHKQEALREIDDIAFRIRKGHNTGYQDQLMSLGSAIRERIALWRAFVADAETIADPLLGGRSELEELIATDEMLHKAQAASDKLGACAKRMIDTSVTNLLIHQIQQNTALNRGQRRDGEAQWQTQEVLTIFLDFMQDTTETIIAALEMTITNSDGLGASVTQRLEASVVEDIIESYLTYTGQDLNDADHRQRLLATFGDYRL